MEFTSKQFSDFRKDLNDALSSLEEKYDVTISAGSFNYDEATFTSRLQVIKGNKEDAERIEFEKYCWRFGFKKEDYNSLFQIGGLTYQLYGFKPRAKKYPAKVKNVITGKKYAVETDMITSLSKSGL